MLAIAASHVKLLTELDGVLREQAHAASQRQPEALQATQRKQNLLDRLEAVGQDLSRLCQAASVEPGRSDLQGIGVTAAMAHAWKQMCQLLERYNRQNRVNTSAIAASRNFAKNLLAILKGQETPAKTCGRSGKLYRNPPGQALGSV
ncbi:MAG: flagellar export chaperone FlgN [Chromatiales bacterium]